MEVTADRLKEQIRKGFIVERLEDMNEEYLRTLKATLLIQADTELMSVAAQYRALRNIPTLSARISTLAVMQDELGHAHIAFRLLKELGEDIDYLLYERKPAEFKNPFCFDLCFESWVDVVCFHALTDRAGFVILGDAYRHTSYGPWKRALVKVDKEEGFHLRHGETFMARMARDPDLKPRLQEVATRMFLLAFEFFGLPDSMKTRPTQLEYRLKGSTNDELRQQYMASAVPFLQSIGLEPPARLNPETGKYELTVPYPVEFDAEKLQWQWDRPVSYDEVIARWRRRGPANEENVAWLRRGYRDLLRLREAVA